jgi:hypothetical protein
MLTKIGFTLCGVALCGTTYALVQQHRQIQALTQLVGEPTGAAVADEREPSHPAGLVTRVRQLETQLGDLGQTVRVERRARREPPEARPASSAESPPAVALPNTERAVMALLDSENPQIHERLRAVVQEEQQRLSDERRDQWQARAAERSRGRVTELAARVGLSDKQTDWLNDTLDAEREQLSDLFAQAREDQNFADMRGKATQLRAATDASVKAQLKDDQFAAYTDMRAEDRRRLGPPPERPGADTTAAPATPTKPGP